MYAYSQVSGSVNNLGTVFSQVVLVVAAIFVLDFFEVALVNIAHSHVHSLDVFSQLLLHFGHYFYFKHVF